MSLLSSQSSGVLTARWTWNGTNTFSSTTIYLLSWGNWQYVAGVGNDTWTSKGLQSSQTGFDYDLKGEYIQVWEPEMRSLTNLGESFSLGRAGTRQRDYRRPDWVRRLLEKIEFTVRKGRRYESLKGTMEVERVCEGSRGYLLSVGL